MSPLLDHALIHGHPNRLRPAIDEILGSAIAEQSRVRQIAAASRTYPEAVEDLVLISCSRYELRLRISWPQLEQSSDLSQIVSSCRWSVGAVVLSGGCRLEVFQKANRGIPVYEYGRSWKEGRAEHSTLLWGNSALKKVLEVSLIKGNTCALLPCTLRRWVADRDHLTSTLVLRVGSGSSHAEVFSRRPLPSSDGSTHSRLSESELSKRVEHYLSIVRLL